jgi:SagB-type dehydrogenase family enzyme
MCKNIFRYFLLFMIYIFSAAAQQLKPIQLLPPQLDSGKTLMQALKLRQSSRSFAPDAISQQDLSNLFWAANGINRQESGKRTAPSAMNWQETDIYVVLVEGVYIYNAKHHSLDPIAAGDLRASTGTQGFVKDAPLNIVYVADEEKMAKVSDEDKKLYSALDVGFIAQNVYLYCASQGLAVVVRGSVDRLPLAKLLNLRPSQRIIVAQTIGNRK